LPEVEANGSGSMMLSAMLNRSITVIHGKGSRISAKPEPNSKAKLGGYVLINDAPINQLEL